MRFLFTLLVAIIYSSTSAQKKYAQGYVVDHDGKKTECQILNRDKFVIPEKIKVIFPTQVDPIELGVDDISEFKVENMHYISAVVDIDESSQDPRFLSSESKPKWITKKVFLKTLVDAKVDLFHYYSKNIELFFLEILWRLNNLYIKHILLLKEKD